MLALEPKAQVSSTTNPAWPHLDCDEVMNRLEQLAKDAWRIYQGALGLCGEATFYYHVLQRNPDGVLAMAKELFDTGASHLGDLTISPGESLRNADYGAIVTAWLAVMATDSTLAPVPPQADWMLLTALHDSALAFRTLHPNYQGKPRKAEGIGARRECLWYKECGLYQSAAVELLQPSSNPNLILPGDIYSDVRKTPTNHIWMGIDMAMIKANATGPHAISLESGLTFKDASGQLVDVAANPQPTDFNNWSVSFTYWTWAYQQYATADMQFTDFCKYLHAAIIAPYAS